MTITDLASHPKAYVTVDELAAYLLVSRRTIYHQIDKGTLQAVKIGGSLRIPTPEARRYAEIPARPDTVLGGFCATGTS